MTPAVLRQCLAGPKRNGYDWNTAPHPLGGIPLPVRAAFVHKQTLAVALRMKEAHFRMHQQALVMRWAQIFQALTKEPKDV